MNKKTTFFSSNLSDDILIQYGVPKPTMHEAIKAARFQAFVEQAENKYNYNPETDTIDIKKVFEDLIWPTIKHEHE
jgi:hypothetical protein